MTFHMKLLVELTGMTCLLLGNCKKIEYKWLKLLNLVSITMIDNMWFDTLQK